MDIHQAGTVQDRYEYYFAGLDARAWQELDGRHRFDWAILRRLPYPGDLRLEILDADPSFVVAFMDDAGALYLRRDGADSTLAGETGYRWLGAGSRRMVILGDSISSSPPVRAAVRAELEREAAGSRWNALAETRLGAMLLQESDLAGARRHLEAALASDPRAARAREWLGRIALVEGRPQDALRLFMDEHRINRWVAGYDLRRGQAYRALGDLGKARAAYQRELARDPGNAEARDSLAALGP